MSSAVAVASLRLEGVAPSSTQVRKMFYERGKPISNITLSQGEYEITSLPDAVLRLKKAISVHLDQIDKGYVVFFDDANISASGDTPLEAFSNLGFLISDTWELLTEEKDRLGPGPARQLAVLQMFIGPV